MPELCSLGLAYDETGPVADEVSFLDSTRRQPAFAPTRHWAAESRLLAKGPADSDSALRARR